MSGENKPGYDTLVFFWFAIAMWAVGIAVAQWGSYLQLSGSLRVNALGLTIPSMVSFGCLVVAGIFSIVVAHKIIAMLIYLVHRTR